MPFDIPDIPDNERAKDVLLDGKITEDEHADVIKLLRFQLGLREHYEARIDQLNKEHEAEKEVMLDRHDDAMEQLKVQFQKVLAFVVLGVIMSFSTILIGLGHDPATIITSAFTLGGGLITTLASQFYKSIPAHIRTFFSNLIRNLPKVDGLAGIAAGIVGSIQPAPTAPTTPEPTPQPEVKPDGA